MNKFTRLFLILAAYMLWTYSVMPDLQTSWVAWQTGVPHFDILALWIISLAGVGVFFYLLYREGETPE